MITNNIEEKRIEKRNRLRNHKTFLRAMLPNQNSHRSHSLIGALPCQLFGNPGDFVRRLGDGLGASNQLTLASGILSNEL